MDSSLLLLFVFSASAFVGLIFIWALLSAASKADRDVERMLQTHIEERDKPALSEVINVLSLCYRDKSRANKMEGVYYQWRLNDTIVATAYISEKDDGKESEFWFFSLDDKQSPHQFGGDYAAVLSKYGKIGHLKTIW